ncbi:MAG: DNA primase [Marinilabiliales bacterium]|nr:DNA primase [Marinilabiliales bacterium]
MIDQATVQRILDTAEITEVVGEFVTLKRRGTNLLGLCPFHNEKTPSFNVSPSKGIYKCFGCGKGGSSVNFIMEHEHLSYVEALRWLARKYHIEVQEREERPEDIQERNDHESQIIVSEFAQKYFAAQMWETEFGKAIGLGYFHERGFRDETVRKFGLGYCPEGKDLFTQAALKEGYKMEYLEKTGLTIKREDWIRDRFAGRVMFPIHSISGRVIAFGGRTLSQDKTIAKYLNSPESDIYHKSRIVYGIYPAKRAIIQEDKCYLVEGYTDVMALHQSGIENVVASSGTSLTVDQIRLIRRFTKNITIIYDGDPAGIKASMRGIDLVLEEGINVKVLPLPEGEDPDSFSKTLSSTQLKAYIRENETDFIKFKTRILLTGTENDPLARARLITDIVGSISVIPEEIVRTEYLKECSRLLDVKEDVLYNEIRKLKQKKLEASSPAPREESAGTQESAPQDKGRQEERSTQSIVNPFELEEKEILRVLLKYGHLKIYDFLHEESGQWVSESVASYVLSEMEIDNMTSVDPLIQKILEEYKGRFTDPEFDAARYFSLHPNPAVSMLASDLLSEKHPISPYWERGGSYIEKEEDLLQVVIPKLVREYKLRVVSVMMIRIEAEMKLANATANFDQSMELMATYQKMKEIEKILCKQLDRTYNPKK